ncbi:hypothetical protein CC2G_007353 [Coprinopsis cinerea AmutBmut pab1-1]|nr:hypothetical protein CC2G_007353 [Coprinopsis cinerea AmutBmut pab1-1]
MMVDTSFNLDEWVSPALSGDFIPLVGSSLVQWVCTMPLYEQMDYLPVAHIGLAVSKQCAAWKCSVITTEVAVILSSHTTPERRSTASPKIAGTVVLTPTRRQIVPALEKRAMNVESSTCSTPPARSVVAPNSLVVSVVDLRLKRSVISSFMTVNVPHTILPPSSLAS